jgi:hypothetical protein
VLASRLDDGPRDPEITDQRTTFVEQHVPRLDVAMHDVLLVCIVEPTSDLSRYVHYVAHWQAYAIVQQRRERSAGGKRHHVVQQTVVFVGSEQRQDVGMIQRPQELDLSMEPHCPHSAAELRIQDLERHRPPIRQPLGIVDRRHATPPQPVLDVIDGFESFAHGVEVDGQGWPRRWLTVNTIRLIWCCG